MHAAALLVHALAYARAPFAGVRAPLASVRAPHERHAGLRAADVAAVDRLHRARARVDALKREPPAAGVAPQQLERSAAGAGDSGGEDVLSPAFARRAPEASIGYDPEASARRFSREGARVLRRQLELALPLAAFALSVLADRMMGVEKQNRRQRAASLLALLSRCGPAVIKAGQALASRSDLLPAEYLSELQRLQDDVPPFPTAEAFKVLHDELGVPPTELFAYISDEPIAAASLGQVYKAIRRATYEPLAVKVQRPGSLELALLDLHILRGCAGVFNALIRAFNRDVDVVAIIDDFGTLLLGELDYTQEAANAIRFARLYARPAERVGAPRVFLELTTRRVLVESWVDGVRLNDHAALARWGLEPDSLVQSLVRCSLRQMLDDGFFHAGPTRASAARSRAPSRRVAFQCHASRARLVACPPPPPSPNRATWRAQTRTLAISS